MASRHAGDLSPEAYRAYIAFYGEALNAGIDILLYCTYRSKEEQHRLYQQGRTEPGKTVTWTLDSKHSRVNNDNRPASDAFDVVPLFSGKLGWDRIDLLKRLGKIGQRLGLRWGGDWNGNGLKDPKDCDYYHFEYRRSVAPGLEKCEG
jgi:peptidoglycan L-alanyl-D-glutamate endopeptidase CwlK